MSTLKVGSITVIVNGYTINNGLPYFQKAVPAALRQRIGKATIKIPLKPENGNLIIQCHRLEQQYSSLFKAMKTDSTLTPSKDKQAAIALLATYGLKPGDGLIEEPRPSHLSMSDSFDPTAHISAIQDELEERFGTRNNLSDAAFKVLNNKLPVLLSEAFAVYLENHNKGQDKEFQSSQLQHWNKLILLLGDIGIESVTREMARNYRDNRLSAGLSSASVKRELNTIRAVFNKAIREIPLNIKNPFESLQIPQSNHFENTRTSFTREEMLLLLNAAIKKNDEKRRIVIALALTGARLAEIVGLRKKDLDISKRAITITPHISRSIKTNQSRVVPLLALAFEALESQYKDSSTDYLFPTYATSIDTNSDSASATLNKWSKGFVPMKSMHCFRHSFRDQMREAMCPESVSKEIGGWASTHDVSVEYGQGYSLDVKRNWLSKAYSWIDGSK
jgi:integrase